MLIRDFLESRHIWFQTLLHAPMPTASQRAQSVHVPGRQVAKGVLIRAGESYALAVLPATARIDLARLSKVLAGPVSIAREDELERVFGDCERGALPPFGRLYGIPTIVDVSLGSGAEIVCVANSRHEGVRLRYRDYEALEAPLRARFAIHADPPRRRAPQRWAG
jgi:Ala-tRNA(Pro) deacylase